MGLVSLQGLDGIARAKGLSPGEAAMAEDLVKVLRGHQARNAERTSYYEGEEGLKNIGIAIPPELATLRMSCSWPAKAVDALADRSVLDSVSFRDGDGPEGVRDALAANHLEAKYNKAKRSQGVHGCSFWTVTGGISARLPVLIRQHSCQTASGIWDDANDRIKAGLVIAAFDRRPGKSHRPTLVNMYTDSDVLVFTRAGNGRWVLDRRPHPMGRPMMEAMVYAPTVAKPLGTSRISQAVMSITDCAIREALRSEIHAEMFTAPQKYLLGATKKQVSKMTRYEAFFGSIFALEADENQVEKPTFGQLSQSSMEPHISYMRQLAAQFSGTTDVPISTLGVVHDNPSSAEAIAAAEQPLVIKAEAMNADNAAALEAVVQMATAIVLNKPLAELTPDEAACIIGFKRPDRPSLASLADAALKIASTPGLDYFGGSDICLQMLGFSEADRLRLTTEKRRAEGRRLVGQFMEGRQLQEPRIVKVESVKEAPDALDESEAGAVPPADS